MTDIDPRKYVEQIKTYVEQEGDSKVVAIKIQWLVRVALVIGEQADALDQLRELIVHVREERDTARRLLKEQLLKDD